MTHFSPTVETLRRVGSLKPNFSAIARELDVTPQHVRRVFLGLSTSARVRKALDAEVRDRARRLKREGSVVA